MSAPADVDVRAVLSEIWCTALNRRGVDDDDNFFESGGHSLTGVIMLSNIEKRLGVSVTLTDFYETATFAELLDVVGRAPEVARPGGEAGPVERASAPRASLMQERLLLDAARSTEPVGQILMNLAYRIEGPIDVARLAAAIQLVGERHEILRTSFDVAPDMVMQQIDPKPGIPIEVVSLTGPLGEDPATAARQHVSESMNKPFDRRTDAMIRCCIVRSEPVTVLLIVIDRLICDAGSLRILLDDLSQAYAGLERAANFRLPPAERQFADWTSWQRRSLSGETGEAMEKYWLDLLGTDPAILGTPLPGYRPPQTGASGDSIELSLGVRQSEQIRDAARRLGVTLYAYLMTGMSAAVSEMTGRPDLYLMTPVTNRSADEYAQTVGDLSHDIYLRVSAGDDDIAVAARRVQAAVAQALENRLVPTTQIWERLWPETYLQVFEEPVICFSLNERSATDLHLAGATVHRMPDAGKGAIAGLDFWIDDDGSEFVLRLSFAAGSYSPDMLRSIVTRMVAHLSR